MQEGSACAAHLYVSSGSGSVEKNCLSTLAMTCGLLPGGGRKQPCASSKLFSRNVTCAQDHQAVDATIKRPTQPNASGGAAQAARQEYLQ